MNNTNGEDDKLTIEQEAFLMALVTGEKFEQAAKSVNISMRTAYRWQASPLFQSALRDVRQVVFNEKLAALKTHVGVALKTLHRHMTDKNTPPAVQVRAAQIWLDQAIAVYKIAEIEEKVAEMEQLFREFSELSGGYLPSMSLQQKSSYSNSETLNVLARVETIEEDIPQNEVEL